MSDRFAPYIWSIPYMNIYDKIKRMPGNETFDEKMYIILNSEKYRNEPYCTDNLGEGMAVVKRVILYWWKPRFVLNHNTKTAFEFMTPNECLNTVTEDDIDWTSLKGLPKEALERAHNLDFHFPSFIRGFTNGVSKVSWQLNPDGQYYVDDDGFGMTSDKKIEIYGFIDTEGYVVEKFRLVKNDDELDEMRASAERKVSERDMR